MRAREQKWGRGRLRPRKEGEALMVQGKGACMGEAAALGEGECGNYRGEGDRVRVGLRG